MILGAGPAGIACATTLAAAGKHPYLIEREHEPGGLCRTLDFNGYLFDIGGHRFISKSETVNRLWHEIMDGELLRVKRLSRIYYRKHYFNYPLSFMNTFWNLGPLESLHCVMSYLTYIYGKPCDDATFEGWITNHFGRRLYEIFFKSYTEKVWEMACKDISADWAKQRIRGLSLRVAIEKAIGGIRGHVPKTLCEEFFYPKQGPGEFYRRLSDAAAKQGAKFLLQHSVEGINHDGRRITAITIRDLRTGEQKEMSLDYLFSTIPLPIFVTMLNPAAPAEIIRAARALTFRSFLVVNVILDKAHIFRDQWLYVHSPEVRLGRIQNYKNWSPVMVPDPRKTTLGLEYFCTEGDQLWNTNDVDLIHYAVGELEKIGIVSRKHLISGFVVRYRNAYPVYTLDYRRHVAILRQYLSAFANFQTTGRAGLFRYDNSDQALLSGMQVAGNFLGGKKVDLWEANKDDGYGES